MSTSAFKMCKAGQEVGLKKITYLDSASSRRVPFFLSLNTGQCEELMTSSTTCPDPCSIFQIANRKSEDGFLNRSTSNLKAQAVAFSIKELP